MYSHFLFVHSDLTKDLIIFPEEAVYKRAKDRAFVLEFKDSSRKLFFWMQEPKDDKDEEYLSKINQHINNPPQMDASMFQ